MSSDRSHSPTVTSTNNSTISNEDPSTQILGNVPDTLKLAIGRWPFQSWTPRKLETLFAKSVQDRIRVDEVWLMPDPEEKERWIAKVVCGMRVEEDMVNGMGNIHGACSTFLIDMCSSLAVRALAIGRHNNPKLARVVSQSLITIYSAPAAVGEELRIVNTTIALGTRVTSIKTEIWSKTHHRLVSSGIHIKMAPSPPKAKM
ncbi:hypothetical protein K435DRAFT_748081 [Dendrothele bispora CBS 962.96]|uniref:Thioesterase domain-containing protein n=1 Tax=Dendrothele bispora (strain CBS 962.96) TaxID=1314807 RepID=A0A4S8MKL7_DENBC|nr:hypothetical protein K435DRAFT_748081 [Dendrothele bispora CBS 962.96]